MSLLCAETAARRVAFALRCGFSPKSIFLEGLAAAAPRRTGRGFAAAAAAVERIREDAPSSSLSDAASRSTAECRVLLRAGVLMLLLGWPMMERLGRLARRLGDRAEARLAALRRRGGGGAGSKSNSARFSSMANCWVAAS